MMYLQIIKQKVDKGRHPVDKSVLYKKLAKCTAKHLRWSPFAVKLQVGLQLYSKKYSTVGGFLGILRNISECFFSQNTFGLLFLIQDIISQVLLFYIL